MIPLMPCKKHQHLHNMYIYTLDDLYDSIVDHNRNTKSSYCESRTMTKKIIRKYFNKVRELVLDGFNYEFIIQKEYYSNISDDFTKDLGSICINKRRAGRKYTLAYNPRTVGFWFEIVATWDLLNKNKMRFKADSYFRRKLTRYLRSGERDYYLKEHTQK